MSVFLGFCLVLVPVYPTSPVLGCVSGKLRAIKQYRVGLNKLEWQPLLQSICNQTPVFILKIMGQGLVMQSHRERLEMTLESTGALSVAQWVGSFSDTRKSLVPSPALCRPGLEAHACNPNIWEVEEGGSEIQGHLQLHSKAETNLCKRSSPNKCIGKCIYIHIYGSVCSGQLIRLTVAAHPGKL